VLTDGGGPYRRRPIVLWTFGADGCVAHWEQFDGDQRDKALARLEELAAPPPPMRLIENAATRSLERSARVEVLATRGDRLALARMRSEGSSLLVREVDARGSRVADVHFDPGSLDAAYAELDARYAAGEVTEHPAMWAALWDVRRALAARNWERLTSMVAADLVAADHRLLGWGTARSAEQYAAAMRPLTELRPDVALRLDHLFLADHVALFVASWTGSEATAAFEIPVVIVFRARPDGCIDRVHHYSLEQIGAARARFAELAAPPAPARLIDTAATRECDMFDRAWAARDWEVIAAEFAQGYRYEDRRAMVQLTLDREQWFEFSRPLFDMSSSRLATEALATRGDRLVLNRTLVEVADDSIGPSAIDSLLVVELDAAGKRLAHVRFDPDALDAATAELDARYAAGEAAAFPRVTETMRAFRNAFARRDWAALAARMAPDVVVHDHRLLGWETVRGADAYAETLHSLVDLAPDTRLRLDHAEMSQRGLLWIGAWVGTREGGAFETPWITVSEHDARGIVLRFDQYDLAQLDAARARFAELAAPATRLADTTATRASGQFDRT
jgi:hypothetical protein